MPEKSGKSWGSTWTVDKLDRFEKYIKAYMLIMTKNRDAQNFRTHYVDAFAGTGYIVGKEEETENSLFLDEYFEEEVDSYIKGSAIRALEIERPFDRYVFIEKRGAKCEELRSQKKNYPNLADRITIERGDANEVLSAWCGKMKRNDRAVVFLDPYGMQVEWRLIETIARTQSIDLWILFPLSAVNRMLPHDHQIQKSWRDRLNAVFGTDEWEREFYKPSSQMDFIDNSPGVDRNVNFVSIERYWVSRLATIFDHVAKKPLTLRNHRGAPLFTLSFAAGNPKGGSTALKIANYLLKE